MAEKVRPKWKVILNFVTFVALAVLVYAVRHQIWDSFGNLGKIHAWVLLLIPVWQALNYDAYARQARDLFATLGEKLRYKYLYKIILELNFINHILPSGGVSGFSYFSLRLKEKKISTAKSSFVQLLRFVLVFIAFQALLFLSLFLLSIGGHANRLALLIGGSLATLVLVGSIGIAFVIGSETRINAFLGFITQALNKLIHIFRPKHPETINMARAKIAFDELHDNYKVIQSNFGALKRPLLWSMMANVTEVLTLYTVYVAFGHWVNPGAVILAYAVANFAGFLSVLPSGIGIYETLMTATLAIGGISPGLSIPVTVMYRVISMAVQLAPGYYFYYRNLHRKEA